VPCGSLSTNTTGTPSTSKSASRGTTSTSGAPDGTKRNVASAKPPAANPGQPSRSSIITPIVRFASSMRSSLLFTAPGQPSLDPVGRTIATAPTSTRRAIASGTSARTTTRAGSTISNKLSSGLT
jgi:hypothetical protein